MVSLINRLFREGVRRGLGGSQRWMTVAVLAGTLRLLQRMLTPSPEVVWRQAMRPGDRFQVTVMDPSPTRRARRKTKKKAAKAAARSERKRR